MSSQSAHQFNDAIGKCDMAKPKSVMLTALVTPAFVATAAPPTSFGVRHRGSADGVDIGHGIMRITEETSVCSEESPCPDGQYCSKETGSCDGPGVCKDRPEVCTMQYEHVCGCDNKIYGNDCGAYARGMSVAYEGECGSRSGNGWRGWGIAIAFLVCCALLVRWYARGQRRLR